MSPAQPAPGTADRFTYSVLLPFQGERVVVQGQGNVQEEITFRR